PPGRVDLWKGPGYPIVLLPFVEFHLPWLAAKMLNALFIFGAILYFQRTLSLFLPNRTAICFSFLLGIYPSFVREVHLLLTASLAIFLVDAFGFYFSRLHHNRRQRYADTVVASALLAYLAVTKVFFGYVLPAVILALLILSLWARGPALRRSLLVYVLA